MWGLVPSKPFPMVPLRILVAILVVGMPLLAAPATAEPHVGKCTAQSFTYDPASCADWVFLIVDGLICGPTTNPGVRLTDECVTPVDLVTGTLDRMGQVSVPGLP